MTHRKLAVISKYIRVGDENTHANNSIGQLDLTSTTSIEPYPLVSSSRSWSPALVVLVCGWTRSIYLKSTFITTAAAAALARLLSSSVQQQKAHQSGPSSASVSSVRLLVWSHSQLQMEMKGGRGGRQQLSDCVEDIANCTFICAGVSSPTPASIHPGTIFYHHLPSLRIKSLKPFQSEGGGDQRMVLCPEDVIAPPFLSPFTVIRIPIAGCLPWGHFTRLCSVPVTSHPASMGSSLQETAAN